MVLHVNAGMLLLNVETGSPPSKACDPISCTQNNIDYSDSSISTQSGQFSRPFSMAKLSDISYGNNAYTSAESNPIHLSRWKFHQLAVLCLTEPVSKHDLVNSTDRLVALKEP